MNNNLNSSNWSPDGFPTSEVTDVQAFERESNTPTPTPIPTPAPAEPSVAPNTVQAEKTNTQTSTPAEMAPVSEDEFPLRLFPPTFERIVEQLFLASLYPVAYTAMSILFVFSVLIGHTIELVTNLGRTACNLFIALIGLQGEDKTRPLKWATAPLVQKDMKLYDEYLEEKREYVRNQNNGAEDNFPPSVPPRTIMSNYTNEALLRQLAINDGRGLGLCCDELAEGLNASKRYRSTNDSEVFLSLFSCAPYQVDRITHEEVFFIDNPFLSFIGGIQNDIVLAEFKGKRQQNGLLARMLIVAKLEYTPKHWNLKDAIDYQEIEQDYNALLQKFEHLEKADYHLSEEAKDFLQTWQNEEEDRLSVRGTNTEWATFRKIQIYALKFSLLFQILWDLETGKVNPEHLVTFENAVRAVSLTNYFYKSATEFAAEIAASKDTGMEKQLLDALPPVFTAEEGLQVAKKLGIGKTRYFGIIGQMKGDKLERTRRGIYTKVIKDHFSFLAAKKIKS